MGAKNGIAKAVSYILPDGMYKDGWLPSDTICTAAIIMLLQYFYLQVESLEILGYPPMESTRKLSICRYLH